MKRPQAPWMLGAAAGVVLIAALVFTMRTAPPPSPSARRRTDRVAPSDGSGVPAPIDPRTQEPGAPAADAGRPSGARTHTLRELREARREARLAKRRLPGSPDSLPVDADGEIVPVEVLAAQDRFPTTASADASELARPLGGPTGSVSFWLQPQWDAGSQADADVLEIADGQLRLVKNVDFLRLEIVDEDGVEHGVGASIADWAAGEWHQVAGSWDGRVIDLYVDGVQVREAVLERRVVLPERPSMLVGSDFPASRPVAPGMVGGLRVQPQPLSPDEVQRRFVKAYG